MINVNIGSLDRRISIEYPVITQDAYGAAITSWAMLATVWANVQDMLPSRSEAVTKGLELAKNQTRIRFRYLPAVTSGMRIIIKGASDRVMQIVGGPSEIGRHEFMEVVAEDYSS